MDALCAAVPIARSLLRLGERSATAWVELSDARHTVGLRVVHGLVHEVRGVEGELLGDQLLRMGALDLARHHAALSSGNPESQIGTWLAQVGAASEAAVRAALAQQLRARIASLLRMEGARLTISSMIRQDEPPRLAVQVDLAHAVYAALVTIAQDLPLAVQRSHAGRGPLAYTRLGAWLIPHLAGCEADGVRQRGMSCEMPELAQRAAFRAVGALADAAPYSDAYSLLLRKRRELRGSASPRRLLDLPEGAAPHTARAAFRRLAHKLHPDRFQARAPALLALSNEVMCGLTRAFTELSQQVRS